MRFLETDKHPLARSGMLKGKPTHEEIVEDIAFAKTPFFLINTMLNDRKNFLNIFVGNIRDAHEAGCTWYKEHFEVSVRKKADIMIVSSSSFSKDIILSSLIKQ